MTVRLMLVFAAVALAACERPDTADAPVPADSTVPAPSMQLDPAVMQRHGEDAVDMADSMRAHITAMRSQSAAQWHAGMTDHTRRVSALLSLLNSQIREMDMGMGMSDTDMGAMMGLTAAQYRELLQLMESVRTDTEQLQTSTVAELDARMRPHLDRLDTLVAAVARAGAHMRAGGSAHSGGGH